jgi:predicted  nucleic acid-binding Zn-ribbon protein
MDSVFSEYHREAWDQYRLFLLESKEDQEIQTSWKEYMEPYMDNSGWYSMDMESADAIQRVLITDDGGEHLNQEILDYMKFGIFEDMPDAEGAIDLLKNLKEASSVGKLSESFSGHTREAVRLERALEDINDSLKKQKDHWQKAGDRLEDYDGSGFREEAGKLEKETERIPSLVKTYGRLADHLKTSLTETNKKKEELKNDISQEVYKDLYEDTNSYESYVNQDGARRREIEALPDKLDQLKPVINQAKERADEVEEIIDNWDGGDSEDDDDDEPDYSELWGSVEDIWNRIKIPVMSYSNGVKDPEKQKILEKVEDFAQKGLLTLVLPEGSEISKGVINGDSFPSASMTEDGKVTANLLDRIIFEEYCGRFLTSFLSEEDKDIKYEMEYMVSGKKSDEDNLKQVVTDIVAIREGMNLIHILSDSQKREEAKALAGLITGVTGTAPLTGVVAFFIMGVWALGESIVDVKMLLEGKNVVFLKSKETWNLTLSNLLELGNTGTASGGKEGDKGIDYTGYLKLLLFLGKQQIQNYRLMDVIQWNVCRKQGDFRMENCIYQAEIRGNIKSKHLFFGGRDPFYPVDVRTEKAY